MARILIVDDSLFVRVTISKFLSGAGLEVVGLARDGEEGVRLAEQFKPDLVIMDIAMPGIGGIEATKRIMEKTPTRILIFSESAGKGRLETLAALEGGALDFLEKPELKNISGVRQNLVKKIEALLDVASPPIPGGVSSTRSHAAFHLRSFRVVAIGVSTGGPGALEKLLGTLPTSFPQPILIAQHMPPRWTVTLADYLNNKCKITVREACDGETARSGEAYLAPGDHHISLDENQVIHLEKTPAKGGFRPSANVLFRSVANSCGRKAVAVIMTGMGSDGLEGIRAVRERGGTVIAQNESSCIVYGMPKAVVDAGLAHAVLCPEDIAKALIG